MSHNTTKLGNTGLTTISLPFKSCNIKCPPLSSLHSSFKKYKNTHILFAGCPSSCNFISQPSS